MQCTAHNVHIHHSRTKMGWWCLLRLHRAWVSVGVCSFRPQPSSSILSFFWGFQISNLGMSNASFRRHKFLYGQSIDNEFPRDWIAVLSQRISIRSIDDGLSTVANLFVRPLCSLGMNRIDDYGGDDEGYYDDDDSDDDGLHAAHNKKLSVRSQRDAVCMCLCVNDFYSWIQNWLAPVGVDYFTNLRSQPSLSPSLSRSVCPSSNDDNNVTCSTAGCRQASPPPPFPPFTSINFHRLGWIVRILPAHTQTPYACA